MNNKIKINPINFGLVGAITFAIVYTGMDYFIRNELGLIGLIGGIVWFFSALITYSILKRSKKK